MDNKIRPQDLVASENKDATVDLLSPSGTEAREQNSEESMPSSAKHNKNQRILQRPSKHAISSSESDDDDSSHTVNTCSSSNTSSGFVGTIDPSDKYFASKCIEKEEEEIKKRRLSIIVHGLKESTATSARQRLRDDCGLIEELLHKLKCDEVSVDEVLRLGIRSYEAGAKARPIRVVTTSEDQKERVLHQAKNLRSIKEGGWDKVFVHQDLTPKQREVRKLLVQELKERKADGEQDLTIFNVKIVKKKRRLEEHANDFALAL